MVIKIDYDNLPIVKRGKETINGRGRGDANTLEIELLENGDISVGAIGAGGERVYLDFPNPVNGGGDREVYAELITIYHALLER